MRGLAEINRDNEPRRTTKALRECAEWLTACLRLGWSKKSLDALEAIWWEHHDHAGRPK